MESVALESTPSRETIVNHCLLLSERNGAIFLNLEEICFASSNLEVQKFEINVNMTLIATRINNVYNFYKRKDHRT